MMRRSIVVKPSKSKRWCDMGLAAKALGRPLKSPEVLHHHSATQLVICQDREYHRLLHFLAYRRRLATNKAFAKREKAWASMCVHPPLWFNCRTWDELQAARVRQW